jgi:hypothetical protein
MTMDVSAIVERCLNNFLAGPESELRAIALEHRALPVYSDLGGTLFITPSLEVLALDHDGGVVPTPEPSENWRLVALVSAAEKYLELQCLIPPRPPNALPCSPCGGTGRVAQLNTRCGKCCGLGWQALHSNNSFESDALKTTRASS